MRLIIAGSRDITNEHIVQEAIELTNLWPITEIVLGGARGVDKLGEQWAEQEVIAVKAFPADWKQYGAQAGILRNIQMAEYADALIAIWDGSSPGTKHMIDTMVKVQKPVFIYPG